MMRGFKSLVLFLVFCHCLSCFGQSPVRLSINERFQFVLSENDEELIGLDIQSPSGSLLPGEASASGPFAFALVQRKGQVTLGNLGSNTTLTEPAKLPARWSPAGVPDVWWQYGERNRNGESSGPFFVFDNPPETEPDPDIAVTLNEENKFVLSGSGEELIGISFQSESGSLAPGPAGDSGPFSVVYQNDSRQMSYGQISSEQPLVLDGSLTLPGGWSQLGQNDVQYHYNQVGPVHSGPITLALGDHSGQLQVALDDQFRFVLRGNVELEQVRITSPSGSLTPASSTAPFQELNSNTPESIVYSTAQPVSLDGALTLDARWNRNLGIQDLEFGYSATGDLVVDSLLPGSFYPTQTVAEPIRVLVDRESNLSVRGNGQELRTLQLDSPTGSLRADGADTGPFSSYTTVMENRVTLESSDFVTIDGTVTLPVRYLLGSGQRDLTFRYSQTGVQNAQGPFDATYAFNTEPIRAWIDVDLGFWVQGSGHRVRELDFRSTSGSLVPGEDPAPFEQFQSNTSEQITLLGNVELDGRLKLDLGWDENVAADVSFAYKLQDSEVEFGPFGVRYPSPNQITVLAALALTDRLTLIGDDQIITSVEITSASGSLQLLEAIDPDTGLLPGSPFEIVESFTPERILLRSAEGVLIDDISLPLAWDSAGEADLQAIFEGLGERAIVPRFAYNSRTLLPEPSSGLLLLSVFPFICLWRKRWR